MILSGCVTRLNNSPSVFALSNAAIIATAAQPGMPTNVPPPPVAAALAQPPATPPVSLPAVPLVNMPATPPVTLPATPSPTVPPSPPPNQTTSGINSAAPATMAINTAPWSAINGAAQPTVSASSYRLSGMNLSPFSGRRVQIVGVVDPASAQAAGAVGTNGTTPNQTLPEVRVLSVQPIGGDCPQQ